MQKLFEAKTRGKNKHEEITWEKRHQTGSHGCQYTHCTRRSPCHLLNYPCPRFLAFITRWFGPILSTLYRPVSQTWLPTPIVWSKTIIVIGIGFFSVPMGLLTEFWKSFFEFRFLQSYTEWNLAQRVGEGEKNSLDVKVHSCNIKDHKCKEDTA